MANVAIEEFLEKDISEFANFSFSVVACAVYKSVN